ncbi:MAG TPA: amidohydrolase family protein [Geomonas sp.]|nr:amidohydrolase family protein [Geomonas sp.]
MTGLTAAQTAWYLAAVAELRSSCRLYDIHVHPYEVLFDRFSYGASQVGPGVWSLPGKSYAPPATGPLKLSEVPESCPEPRSQRLCDIGVMLLSRVYGSVGPRVFLDHMELSGVDQVLLLPVASEKSDSAQFDLRMQWILDLYGADPRFWLAGSIPPAVEWDEIERYAASLKKRFGIRALKCHPVVSGIDLGTGRGKAWLEALLEACQRLALPLVIHGGSNNPYWGGARGNFGSLRHLVEINLSLSRFPVVLAHAGLHRCTTAEMKADGLALLKQMLDRHNNLYVDISGLEFEQLSLVVDSIGQERILFGSDALYAPQWEVVAATVHALRRSGRGWQDRFLQYASINPQKVFDTAVPCAETAAASRSAIDNLTKSSPKSPPFSITDIQILAR